MKNTLKVGFEYLNRFGKTVKIVDRDGSRFYDSDGIKYGLVGVAIDKGANWDLINFADGFPLFTMKLSIPVEKIDVHNSRNSYRHEDHEVIIKYIGKIPQGRHSHETSKRFDYCAHYVIPEQFKEAVKDYPYTSKMDGDLFTTYIDRKLIKFGPKKFFFTHSYISIRDEKIAKTTGWE